MGGYSEIVKALRLCSAVNSSCEECPCNDPADDLCECANKVGIAAADAIENLLTENAALRRQIDNLTSAQALMVKEFEGKMEELHDSKSELNAAIAGQETVTNRNGLNEPLTLEQLRQMDGEPAWFVSMRDGFASWGIVRVVEMSKAWFIAVAGAERAFGDIDGYGKTWMAYRKKLEGAK